MIEDSGPAVTLTFKSGAVGMRQTRIALCRKTADHRQGRILYKAGETEHDVDWDKTTESRGLYGWLSIVLSGQTGAYLRKDGE